VSGVQTCIAIKCGLAFAQASALFLFKKTIDDDRVSLSCTSPGRSCSLAIYDVLSGVYGHTILIMKANFGTIGNLFGSKVDEQGALIARQQHQIEALTAGLKKRTISNRLMEQGTKNLMFHHRHQSLPFHFSERLRLETSTLNARNVRMPSTSSRARETRSGTHRSMPTVDVTTIDSTLLLRAPRI